MANDNLNQAKLNKADEFYTSLFEIEEELKHYRSQFMDKIIFCNCDDPYESNFFKYFAINFNTLGLKKLIATCYNGSPVAYTQLSIFVNYSGEPIDVTEEDLEYIKSVIFFVKEEDRYTTSHPAVAKYFN